MPFYPGVAATPLHVVGAQVAETRLTLDSGSSLKAGDRQ